MKRTLATLVFAAAPVLLAGCGGNSTDTPADEATVTVDEASWRWEAETALGHELADWPLYRDLTYEQCEGPDRALSAFAAVAADEGTPAEIEAFRLSIYHACPDRLDVIYPYVH